MEQLLQVFKALSDETRLKILVILSRRRICAKGLARHLIISEAAVSQHIKILKQAGLIVGEKEGYFVYYRLQKEELQQTAYFIEHIAGNHTKESSQFSVSLPNECKVACKGSQRNRCCHRKIEWSELN